jgi:putative YhdH/YhfP family quinone oxidoreductase
MARVDSSKKVYFEQDTLSADNLPKNELLINVKYSALGYADALSLSEYNAGAKYPYVPGMDAAGVVVKSTVPDFLVGDEVLVTGFGLGSSVPGSLGGYISVPAEWALKLPVGLTMKSAMTLGTSGLAAGIGVLEFKNAGMSPDECEIAVTGASWDMGAVAAALFSTAGFKVSAYISGGNDVKEYVAKLGVANVKNLSSLGTDSGSVLDNPLYDGAFDTMGGVALSSLAKIMKRNAIVLLACGAESMNFSTSLYPFLYRGINMIGVEPVNCAPRLKMNVWQMISGEWMIPNLDWLCTEISLDELQEYVPRMISRDIKGRVIINHKL